VLSIYWLVMGMYFVMAPVCIAKQLGIGAALSRCRFLTKGRRRQIFVATLLAGIVSLTFNNISLGVAFVSRGREANIAIYTAIFSIWIVFGAFSAVTAAVFYDRLRLAKDGTHLAKVFTERGHKTEAMDLTGRRGHRLESSARHASIRSLSGLDQGPQSGTKPCEPTTAGRHQIASGRA
jgi:hypothetical protein